MSTRPTNDDEVSKIGLKMAAKTVETFPNKMFKQYTSRLFKNQLKFCFIYLFNNL